MIRQALLLALLLLLAVFVAVLTPAPGENTSGAIAAENEARPADGKTPLGDVPREFRQAGVCARCHVVSVLEWGVSGHVEAETDCRKCHGPSHGHVANERNEVKPDRLPRGEAIAKQLCSTCHQSGCPETLQVQTCQKCHHVHALINPAINPAEPSAAKDDRLDKLVARWQQFQERMDEGERHVQGRDWISAQAAFRGALRLIPGSHQARRRLEMCGRRLNPKLPGFSIVGDSFDATTGLPREVRVVELDIGMLLVPPGEFDMGADELVDSRPVHTVRIDAFYLGRYEVTQGQWKAVMGDNPSAHQGKDFPHAERMPVERVSWDDCQEFLRRLNGRVAGGGFRLPTEAEWEYASRAGRKSDVGKESEEELGRHAWYNANSLRQAKAEMPFLQVDAYAPRHVGLRRPNAWGLHDMQGNVAEWCSSLFRPYLYDASDGRESLTGNGMRVLRGGGFADSAPVLNPTLRHAERRHRRLRWNGLRLARSATRPHEE